MSLCFKFSLNQKCFKFTENFVKFSLLQEKIEVAYLVSFLKKHFIMLLKVCNKIVFAKVSFVNGIAQQCAVVTPNCC
jgi:hypothetical protein